MTTRRSILKGGLAAAALTGAPSIIKTQAQPSRARTLKAVMHADLRVLDPIWTTANITAYHGAMIYDTLFGLDADYKPQPQMVSNWGVSDDKLTDRKSTRLNSSHSQISYAVFCLKKKQ